MKRKNTIELSDGEYIVTVDGGPHEVILDGKNVSNRCSGVILVGEEIK